MTTNVLGVIPARGGSKGIPNKNMRELGGKPLLAYAVDAARLSGVIDRLVLTTDSDEIAELGLGLGVEVPFLRPAELAADGTPMQAVLEHVVAWAETQGDVPRIIVLLQPTAPLRRPDDIAESVRILEETDRDSVVSVVALPRHHSPDFVMRIEDARLVRFLPEAVAITRRQDARPAYVRDGTVYAFRLQTLLDQGNIYGDNCHPLVIPGDRSVNLDSEADWEEAERVLGARNQA